MVSQNPANFGDYKHHGSVDVIFWICHMILQDHVIEKSSVFTWLIDGVRDGGRDLELDLFTFYIENVKLFCF